MSDLLRSVNEPVTSRQSFTPVSPNEPPARPDIGDGGELLPTLAQLTPTEATIGDPDLTLQCIGANFTPAAYITFNGGQEPTEWISATEVTTIVKPSTAGTPGEYPVTVVTPFGETAPLLFTFLPAEEVIEETELDTEAAEDLTDPDEMEEAMEQAEEEGDFTPVHRGHPANTLSNKRSKAARAKK